MGWWEDAADNAVRRRAEMQRYGDGSTVEIDIGAQTHPVLRKTIYSCVPDAIRPWDPNVLKAIQEIDPDFRPLWIKFVYEHPDGRIQIVGRHGVARRVSPSEVKSSKIPQKLLLRNVEMPQMPCQGVVFDDPKYEPVEWYLKDGTKEGPHPGSYLPFDYSFAAWLKENYVVLTAEEFIAKYIDAPMKAKEAAVQAAQAVDLEMRKELDRWVNKVLENTSDVELKEFYRPLSLGIGYDRKPTKAFVQLGR
jgi:hypothetical protein